MKTLNLAVIVSTLVILASGFAHGDDGKHNIGHQNLSKRPYHEVLPESAYDKQEQWEGATLIDDNVKSRGSASNMDAIKKININMLGKRPYMH